MIVIFDYKQNGESRTFKFDIDFISRGVRRRLLEILSNIEAAKIKFAERTKYLDELSEAKKTKDHEKINELNTKIFLVEESFSEYSGMAIEEEYIEIIRRILRDNGVKDDHLIFNDQFMDDNITSATLVRFMFICWAIDYGDIKKNETANQK